MITITGIAALVLMSHSLGALQRAPRHGVLVLHRSPPPQITKRPQIDKLTVPHTGTRLPGDGCSRAGGGADARRSPRRMEANSANHRCQLGKRQAEWIEVQLQRSRRERHSRRPKRRPTVGEIDGKLDWSQASWLRQESDLCSAETRQYQHRFRTDESRKCEADRNR